MLFHLRVSNRQVNNFCMTPFLECIVERLLRASMEGFIHSIKNNVGHSQRSLFVLSFDGRKSIRSFERYVSSLVLNQISNSGSSDSKQVGCPQITVRPLWSEGLTKSMNMQTKFTVNYSRFKAEIPISTDSICQVKTHRLVPVGTTGAIRFSYLPVKSACFRSPNSPDWTRVR